MKEDYFKYIFSKKKKITKENKTKKINAQVKETR